MQRYRNLSGDSGVDAYEVGDGVVKVRFKTGVVYWYTEKSVGARHIAEMKRLATRGRGLSTYIGRHADVREGYEKKDPEE